MEDEFKFKLVLFEIVTDPYGKAYGKIHSHAKYDLALPSSEIGFVMFIENNLLFLVPDFYLWSFDESFEKYYRKSVFHTRICHLREYKNEETGLCEPCPRGSASVDGPFSQNCVDTKTGKQVPESEEQLEEEVEQESAESSQIDNKVVIAVIVGTLLFCILILIAFACFLKKVIMKGKRRANLENRQGSNNGAGANIVFTERELIPSQIAGAKASHQQPDIDIEVDRKGRTRIEIKNKEDLPLTARVPQPEYSCAPQPQPYAAGDFNPIDGNRE